jgi:hypothetical protein
MTPKQEKMLFDLGFTKHPSVMTGGKPYFYILRNVMRLVWNRQTKQWHCYTWNY